MRNYRLPLTKNFKTYQQNRESVELLLMLDELERRQCEKSLYSFFKIAWAELEPSVPFIDNWHYEVLCAELQKQIERIASNQSKEYDLLINVPPRSAKSTLVTICLNAWTWLNYAHIKFVTASYDASLALEHAVDTRRLITSPWYQDLWGSKFTLQSDQNVKSFFENNQSGYRIATSVGGSGTGRGGNVIIADDPQSVNQAESELHRKTCTDWWFKTMHSRLNNPSVDLRIIVQQRLHEDDLTGAVLTSHGSSYKHFCFPAEQSDQVSPAIYKKKYKKGLLHPEVFSRAFLDDAKVKLGSYAFSGQYNQTPSPAGGGLFKRKYWAFWKPKNMILPAPVLKTVDGVYTHALYDLPEDFDMVIDAWDMSFKGTTGADRVSGQKWGSLGSMRFLLQQHLAVMGFVDTKKAVIRFSAQEPIASSVAVEDKANGSAVIDELKSGIPGLVGVEPIGSKAARAVDASKAMSVVAQAEAGQIVLPHPAIAPWVDDYIEEFAKFPLGKHDDQVDATVHAVRRLSEGVPLLYTSADLEKDLQHAH